MRGKQVGAIVVAIAVVAGAIGCGETASENRPSVKTAFRELTRDFAAGDLAGVCDRLSTAAVSHLEWWWNEPPPRACPKRLGALVRGDGGSRRASADPAWTASSTSVAGDEARVRARLGERWPVTLPFVWQAGRWKADEITGLSGPPPKIDFEKVVPTPNPFEVASGDPTRRIPVPNGVGTSTATKCARVAIERKPPSVSGGCAVVATFERIAFDVLTLAGPRRLETCGMYFRMVFANDGRAWMSKFGLANVTPDGSCATTLIPCRYSGSGKPYPLQELVPWHGTIERTARGRYGVELDACVDSRVGRFEGNARFAVVARGGAWKAVARHATVGSSGLRVAGRWRLRSLERWKSVWGGAGVAPYR